MAYILIAIGVLLTGASGYFSSAWFGYSSSNTDRLPPHYAHLRRRLSSKKKRRKAVEQPASEDNPWSGNW